MYINDGKGWKEDADAEVPNLGLFRQALLYFIVFD